MNSTDGAAPPPSLFRYRAFNDAVDLDPSMPAYLASTLRDGVIYVARAAQFNDPWEARPGFKLPHDGDLAARLLTRFFIGGSPWAESEERHLRDTIQRLGLARVLDEMRWRFANLVTRTPLLCLSERADNPLLWSHYGAGHRGYVLEFSTSALPICAARAVVYSRDVPLIDLDRADEPEHALHQTLLRKAAEWQQEGEWRVVGTASGAPFEARRDMEVDGGGFLVQLPRGTLRRVILGHRIPDSARTRIRRFAERIAPEVEVVDAYLAADEYRVLIGAEATGRVLVRRSLDEVVR